MTRYSASIRVEIEKWIKDHCAEIEVLLPEFTIGEPQTQSAEIEIDGKPP